MATTAVKMEDESWILPSLLHVNLRIIRIQHDPWSTGGKAAVRSVSSTDKIFLISSLLVYLGPYHQGSSAFSVFLLHGIYRTALNVSFNFIINVFLRCTQKAVTQMEEMSYFNIFIL